MITKEQIHGFVLTAHLAHSKQMAYLSSRERLGEDKACVYGKMFAAYGVIRHLYMYVLDYPMPETLQYDEVISSCSWLMNELKFQYNLQGGTGVPIPTIDNISISYF